MIESASKFFLKFRFKAKLLERELEQPSAENLKQEPYVQIDRPNTEIKDNQVKAVQNDLPKPESLQWGPLPERTPKLSPVEQLDESYLTSSFFRYAEDQSHRFDNAPLEYVAIGLIVTLASMLGNKVRICPKRFDKTWFEFVCSGQLIPDCKLG
tara:strand:- start:8 stop:469 length:462 start_codon:yes stop_codon:yes gene_type:complete